MLDLNVARLVAVLPGYASVKRAADVLHLAPRSVRDLIYSGRLPSLRVGRLHYVRATDLELERRRRLDLRLPARAARPRRLGAAAPEQRSPKQRPHVDPALRRRRAAERAEVVQRWAQRHASTSPDVPFTPITLSEPATCASCGRSLRQAQRALLARDSAETLCSTCGRRALMQWADRRRLEAVAARRLAHDLGGAAETAQVA